MSEITLGQIENDKQFHFNSKYDEEHELFHDIKNSCNYYDVSELKNNFSQLKQGFSIYSHNIRSINGHWDDILDTIAQNRPIKFSILAFQEIWSVQRSYEIPGYNKFEYITRDKNTAPNPNCGGGVGFFVDKNFDYELLNIESAFVPHVYESIWIKVKVKNTAKRNMSSAVCASSMYSRLCMKMSSFLFVRACAVPRMLYLSCGIPFPV